MVVAQLATSPFIGGTERQMLGQAQSLPSWIRSVFILFTDKGKSQAFRDYLTSHSFETVLLAQDTPHLVGMIRELSELLRALKVDLLCAHGYKADIVGLAAARRVGIPVVAVSHGWTRQTWRVRLYEELDRFALRRMDRVVCVSKGQAAKMLQARVRPERVLVIHDAVRSERFERIDPSDRSELVSMFPQAPDRIVGSAGRLSPEKGFAVLVDAATIVTRSDPGVAFVHFGDGPLRETLARRITQLGLDGRFILAGFRDDLDRFLPHFDLSVLPSFTEGLPNVVLESYAAGVPVVATAVGGTPEAVADGVDGYLVPPGDPAALAGRIIDVLAMGEACKAMGQRGRERIKAQFTFEFQALRYQELFEEILGLEATTAGTAGPRSALS